MSQQEIFRQSKCLHIPKLLNIKIDKIKVLGNRIM